MKTCGRCMRLACIFLMSFSSISVAGNIAINKDVYNSLRNTTLIHVIEQDKLIANIAVANMYTGMFGLAEYFSNKERQGIVEKEIASFGASVNDFNFKGEFQSKLQNLMNKRIVERGKFDIKSTVFENKSLSNMIAYYYKTENGMLLTLNTRYYFNESFQVITVSTDFSILYKNRPAANLKQNYKDWSRIIYQSTLSYQSKSISIEADSKKYWNEGNRIEEALKESIEILPEMIVSYLENITEDELEGNSDYWEIALNGFIFVAAADLLKSVGDRRIVRMDYRGVTPTYISLHKDSRYVDTDDEDDEF